MNSDEIDRYIATEVMGWPIHSHGPMSAYLVGPDRIRWPSDWSPSTRIDHAWEVVEKVADMGLLFQMNFYKFNGEAVEHEPWVVEVVGYDGKPFVEGSAETAPLAICRAALEAVKPQ